jgi:hypothetical protein
MDDVGVGESTTGVIMSDCGACIYVGDYDPPDVYWLKWVKARKEHACCECKRTIAPGERYEYVSGKWDGRMGAFHTCAECSDIATSLACDGDRMHGGLWEAMDEVGDTIGFGCLQKLTLASSKEQLRQWINERKGLTD